MAGHAAERTMVFGNERSGTYPATADRWEILVAYPPGRLSPLRMGQP
jgi:hypothetical protein